MLLAQFLTVALVHFLAVVSPGPDFAIVTRNSLLYTRTVGIYTSLGVALGIGVHVLYSVLGIGLLISQSLVLFSFVKYMGAAYLIYLGYRSLKTKPHANDEKESNATLESISRSVAVRTGFLTNVLNPKATLFFLALFTQVIDPTTPKLFVALLAGEMILATFAWFALVALMFSNATMKAKIRGIQHYVERVTGVVLIALGIKVALSNR